MAEPLVSHCMAELTYPDIQAYLKRSDLILIPMASTEQHGPHLPLSTDTTTAYEVSKRAAEQADVLYTPTVWTGYSPQHMRGAGQGMGTITIRAETSQADPDTCKFAVSRTVHPGGPFFFDSTDRASGSPLVERLFALPGVSHVLVAETVVTVGKDPSVAWSALKSAIGAAIRTQLLTGVPAIFEAPRNAGARGRTASSPR